MKLGEKRGGREGRGRVLYVVIPEDIAKEIVFRKQF